MDGEHGRWKKDDLRKKSWLRSPIFRDRPSYPGSSYPVFGYGVTKTLLKESFLLMVIFSMKRIGLISILLPISQIRHQHKPFPTSVTNSDVSDIILVPFLFRRPSCRRY